VPDQKLSELDEATTFADAFEFYLNAGGTSKRALFSTMRDQVRLDAGDGGKLGLLSGRYTFFDLLFTNNAGTLQHKITLLDGSTASPFVAAINGASNVYTNTPTGPDSSTPFAAGLKIGSTFTNRIIFDTADVTGLESSCVFSAIVFFNETGTVQTASPSYASENVNGVTRKRIVISMGNAAVGGGPPIDTTTIPAGKNLFLQVVGFMPDYA
jgi:hypothetical protein